MSKDLFTQSQCFISDKIIYDILPIDFYKMRASKVFLLAAKIAYAEQGSVERDVSSWDGPRLSSSSVQDEDGMRTR